MSEEVGLTRAVLEGDMKTARDCLSRGASPNEIWGTITLLTHAAKQPNSEIFSLLLSHGAAVPKSLLPDIISWELYDYIIGSDEEEDSFLAILDMIKPTEAWLTTEERRLLVQRLDGYLPRVSERLIKNQSDI